MACLAAHAAQTLDQGANGCGTGGCAWARQPVHQMVSELHEEVSAAGGCQVTECPNSALAHSQARAAQLGQQAVQQACVESAQWGT